MNKICKHKQVVRAVQKGLSRKLCNILIWSRNLLSNTPDKHSSLRVRECLQLYEEPLRPLVNIFHELF